MQPVPYIVLAVIVLAKEFVLWHYHRVMPRLVRAAIVIPGVALAFAYFVFQFYEADIPMDFRSAIARWILTVFFIWNGLFLYYTRDQHRKDVK